MKKLFLCLTLAVIAVYFSSCMNGDNSASYVNAYGYVGTSSGVTYVYTSSGMAITWDGISDDLTAGECIRISYSMDYTTLNGFYAATDVSYSSIDSYSVNSGTPISVNDSNFVYYASADMWSTYSYFGDNWYLSYYTKTYSGVTVTPKFYYSLTSGIDSFDVDNDSVIVNIRLNVSGTATSTSTTTSSVQYLAVDLTPIRSLFSEFSEESIPIYFRYYTAASTWKTTTKTTMYID